MQNVILIGMPGSGKSMLGRILADSLSYHFIDTDDVIMDTYEKKLMQLIEENGTEGFITLEGKVVQSIHTNQAVISTGGSVIYHEGAMAYLKSIGFVVYLHHALNDLTQRVGNLVTRGVVCHGGCETLQELFDERCPLYEQYAHIILPCDGKSIDEIVRMILTRL